jgi:hypothetical protein
MNSIFAYGDRKADFGSASAIEDISGPPDSYAMFSCLGVRVLLVWDVQVHAHNGTQPYCRGRKGVSRVSSIHRIGVHHEKKKILDSVHSRSLGRDTGHLCSSRKVRQPRKVTIPCSGLR